MDVIEKLIVLHKDIRENAELLRKLSELIDSEAFIWDNVLKISDFMQREIKDHFALEEKVLFPILIKILPEEYTVIIRKLIKEHRPIIKKMDEFHKIASTHKKIFTKYSRTEFITVSHEIIELLILHSKEEDMKLFSSLRRLLKPEQYNNLKTKLLSFQKNIKTNTDITT